MTLIVQLPAELEQRLRAQSPNLEAELREAMLIELYRQDKLSHHELAQSMGLDRFETDALLKKHNVTEDLLTNEELEQDIERLQQLLDGDR
jgi:predicted HTH domain antitoxin